MPDRRSEAHVPDDDLELYVQGLLKPKHTAAIEFHLLECKFCRKRLNRTIKSDLTFGARESESIGNDKRIEPRRLAGADAILQKLSPLTLERHLVEIIDISKNGLGIWATISLFPGTIVQVRMDSTVELGEVRHCATLAYGGYRIGVQLHRQN